MSNIKVICTDSYRQGIWERYNELNCLNRQSNSLYLNAMIDSYQLFVKEKRKCFCFKHFKRREGYFKEVTNQLRLY